MQKELARDDTGPLITHAGNKTSELAILAFSGEIVTATVRSWLGTSLWRETIAADVSIQGLTPSPLASLGEWRQIRLGICIGSMTTITAVFRPALSPSPP